MTVMSASVQETRRIAGRLADALPTGILAILLKGELGAGKTVFVQGLAARLGVKERVTSPSFLLMKEYIGTRPLRHIDLYRLEDSSELAPVGILEDLQADTILAVEWADRFALPFEAPSIIVEMRRGGHDEMRELRITSEGIDILGLKNALFVH
jgi:tRNA threonylcarbamoyladenosine biosynthesis protein TsaE